MRTLIYARLGAVITRWSRLCTRQGRREPHYKLQQAMVAWSDKTAKSGLSSLDKETSLIADISAILIYGSEMGESTGRVWEG